jgi:hypothetical protein
MREKRKFLGRPAPSSTLIRMARGEGEAHRRRSICSNENPPRLLQFRRLIDSKNRHVRAGARGGLAQSVRTPPESPVNEHTACQTGGTTHSSAITRMALY